MKSRAIKLSGAVRALVDGPNYATLCTLDADGGPVSSAMWVGLDGDDLVFSTVAGRLKDRNIRRDPQVSVTIMERADPERSPVTSPDPAISSFAQRVGFQDFPSVEVSSPSKVNRMVPPGRSSAVIAAGNPFASSAGSVIARQTCSGLWASRRSRRGTGRSPMVSSRAGAVTTTSACALRGR